MESFLLLVVVVVQEPMEAQQVQMELMEVQAVELSVKPEQHKPVVDALPTEVAVELKPPEAPVVVVLLLEDAHLLQMAEMAPQ
jgi:hypothetical protein